jgi:hypothetical protein
MVTRSIEVSLEFGSGKVVYAIVWHHPISGNSLISKNSCASQLMMNAALARQIFASRGLDITILLEHA